MLMHEWLRYRERLVKEADAEAELEREETATDPVEEPEDGAPTQRGAQVRNVLSALERSGSEVARQRLQTAVGGQARLPLEVEHIPARRSGSGVGETREDLIRRLLDPTLTMQETATLLGVCVSTVRRYTKRGALRCFRTPGNQRRFRLSDVLDFMEHSEDGRI